MNTFISTVALARTIAEVLNADRALQHIARSVYDKDWLVESGFNRRRVDWKQIAPFAVVVTGGTLYPEGVPHVEHSIGIVFGVNDSEHGAGDADGIAELRGITVMGDQAWPAAMHAIDQALGVAPGCSIVETQLEFSQEAYPLLYLNAAMTIRESLPVGRR